MIKNLSNLSEKFWFKNILIPLLLVMPILLFSVPIVHLGGANINTIERFDFDESDLIRFAGKTYSRGVVPLEPAVAYPQLFYYLAGIILFPYTFIKGIDYQAIVIILRSFNILIAILSAIMVYFFILRLFKSKTVAILSSLLLATTPQVLVWSVNSRPHLLAMFFTVIALYYCLCLVEKYRISFLQKAVIFSGLATATNFFGIFIIPSICLAYFYSTDNLATSQLLEYLKSRKKLVYFISFLVITLAILIPTSAVFLFFKCRKWFDMVGINSFYQFLHYRNVKIMFLFSGIILIGGLFMTILNLLSGKLFTNSRLLEKYRYILSMDMTSLHFIFITVSIAAVFLIFNPAYFLFPVATLKATFFQFAMTSMGSGLNSGLSRPLFDPAAFLHWFKMLFDNNLLNMWFGIILFVCTLYEMFNFKINWSKGNVFIKQRIVLWAYVVFLFLVLVLCVVHRPHHYLLPINLILGILLSFGSVAITKKIKLRVSRLFVILALIIFYFLGFFSRIDTIIKIQKAKFQLNNTIKR